MGQQRLSQTAPSGEGPRFKFDLNLNLQAGALKGFDTNGRATYTRFQ